MEVKEMKRIGDMDFYTAAELAKKLGYKTVTMGKFGVFCVFCDGKKKEKWEKWRKPPAFEMKTPTYYCQTCDSPITKGAFKRNKGLCGKCVEAIN